MALQGHNSTLRPYYKKLWSINAQITKAESRLNLLYFLHNKLTKEIQDKEDWFKRQ